jgi:DNA-binding NarL/FixJ family response regulator
MILLVDDDPSFRAQADEAFAEKTGGLVFATSAERAMNMLKMMGDHISVALVDLNLDGSNGFDLIAAMLRHHPAIPIIAISGVYGGAALEGARMIGAVEALQKPIDSEWYAVLERVRAGVRRQSDTSRRDHQFPIERLTPREIEVLRLVALGDSSKVVARKLGMSFKTAYTHRQNIMEKLGVHETTALVRYAIRTGLIQP